MMPGSLIVAQVRFSVDGIEIESGTLVAMHQFKWYFALIFDYLRLKLGSNKETISLESVKNHSFREELRRRGP